jgi:predicted metal-binding membrane protein
VSAARRISASPRRSQAALVGGLLAVAAVGWLVTGDRMSGMDAGPGTDPGTLGFYVVSWVVMMAAMMFPSTWPMAAMYERINAARGGPRAATTLFVGGYLAAWTVFGLVAYGLFEAVRSLSIDALAFERSGKWVAGGVLALAAVYQLTPLKEACLRRCRSPFSLVLDGFEPGAAHALALGARHGAWCVGCCWGLMAGLFALGVMSLAWMALVAAVIAAEKLLPWPRATRLAVAATLAAFAISVPLAPDDVPGLTVPGSSDADAAMERMTTPYHPSQGGDDMEMQTR